MKVIAEIWGEEDDAPWATQTILKVEVVPEPKSHVVLRSTEVGTPDARRLKVVGVVALSSLDGYLVTLRRPKFDGKDAFADERSFRRELAALGWTVLAPEQRLPFSADDDDLDQFG